MIRWLGDHQEYSMRVKGNSFSFKTFYHTCTKEAAEELITKVGLNMSRTHQEWEIELLAFSALTNDRILLVEDQIVEKEHVSKNDQN